MSGAGQGPARAVSPPEDDDLYPPSLQPPPRLGQEGHAAYRLRVVLVLVSLFAFLALYLALLAGSAWLVWLCWELPLPRGRDSGKVLVLKVLLGAGAVMLFLFLLKGLFKRNRAGTDRYLRLREQDAPRLFAFVRRLCQETGAPFPRRIYLTHDVNAAVFYPRSLLSLCWPVRKNLLVGLGLVESVSLSELKAVLAHEFGHFAQSSTKLGQYVYVSNQVIADMVFARDRWDELLAVWRSIDLRISFPAWILSGVVWVLRKLLGLAFQGINLLNLSLSRQMEFDADNQAIRLTGSDALISALWKLERASLALQVAQNDLGAMADHGTYSDDLFLHQRSAAERVPKLLGAEARRDARARPMFEPYQPGAAVCFAPSEEERQSAWHTHPPHHARELNAKRSYLPHPIDERPAWLLFPDSARLRAEVTRLAYKDLIGREPKPGELEPAAAVAERIREEQAEVEQAEHYHGLYDDRVLAPGDPDAVLAAHTAARERGEDLGPGLRAEAQRFASGVQAHMERLEALQQDAATLAQAAEEGGPGSFELRGQQVPRRSAKRLLEENQDEQKALREELARGDQALLAHFVWLALGRDQQDELLERYRFLNAIQAQVVQLNRVEAVLTPILQALQAGVELTQEQGAFTIEAFGEAREALVEARQALRDVRAPALSQLQRGQEVAAFVFPERPPPPFPKDRLEGAQVGALCKLLFGGLPRLRRLHFKNLGALLRLQETLDPELFPRGPGRG